MRLVIHIGFHKTGSSAIQSFCKGNRNMLAQNGILYPRHGLTKLQNPSTPWSEAGHRSFENVLVSPTNSSAKNKIGAILDEAKSFGNIHTVLISNETFSAPKVKISTAAMAMLREYFSEVKILAYLRRQDEWADSFYREVLCWSGRAETRSFQRFYNEFLPDWLDYESRLAKWESVFGKENLIVKSYDDRKNNNIVIDFFSNLGAKDIGGSGFEFPAHSNPSLPTNLIPLMLDINSKQLSKSQRSKLTNQMFNEITTSGHTVELEPLLSWHQKMSIIEGYRDGNIAICNKFGIDSCDLLAFSEQKIGKPVENSLTLQQVDSIRQKADELIEEARNKSSLLKQRDNKGRVGVSCLLKEKSEQVKVFVQYHLAIGVSRMRLYFDDPDDPMVSFDFGHSGVEAIRCTSEFWQDRLGRIPETNGEKLSTCHKDGLNYLNQLDDIDWAINLDADELLYVVPQTSLQAYLSAISPRFEQIKVRPLEAIFVDDRDSELFGAHYFKVPRLNFKVKSENMRKGILVKGYFFIVAALRLLSSLKLLRRILFAISRTAGVFLAWTEIDTELYRKYKPVLAEIMREGFLGHRLGRRFTRHGVELDHMNSHEPGRSSKKTSVYRMNTKIFVLHFDAADYSAWYLKWYRRVHGDTTAAAIHDKRRAQQEMFREAVEKGDEAVKKLFEDYFMFPKSSVKDFEKSGLITKLVPPYLDQIKSDIGI